MDLGQVPLHGTLVLDKTNQLRPQQLQLYLDSAMMKWTRGRYEFGPCLFRLVSKLQRVTCAPEVSHYKKKQNLFQTTENPKLYRLFSMKRIMKTQLTEL